MGWRIAVVLFAVLLLGLVRLAFDRRSNTTIGVDAADRVAACLGRAKDVAANTAVTLLPLPLDATAKIEPRAVEKLDFVTTGPVPVELADARGRELIRAGQSFQPESAQQLTVNKGKGDFEFVLPKASAILNTADSQFLIRTKKPLRFGPAERIPYPVEITEIKDLKIESKDEGGAKRVAVLPPGTRGSLDFGVGWPLVPLQPVPVEPWLYDTPSTLLPVRAVGQQGLTDLIIEARQPGLRFDDPGFSLTACAWSPTDAKGKRLGLAETKAQGAGAATVRLAVPSDVIPFFPGLDPRLQIDVAVASLDGQYRAYGGFTAFARAHAAVAATVLAFALFWWITTLRHQELKPEFGRIAESLRAQGRPDEATHVDASKDSSALWFSSLFVGADKEPSLSLFQIFFWTVITVWGLIVVRRAILTP